MHISDGVLSPPVIALTSLGAAGLVAFALRGVDKEELPKIALMTAVFFVGSTIHVPIGPTSTHLLLTGFIGLMVGSRTPIAILIALLLQLFLFHFGGLSSLGANVLIESLPAMLLGMGLRPRLTNDRRAFWYGFAAGFLSILGSVLLLALTLIQSNLRYGMGPLSTINVVFLAHLPIMVVEGFITAFAVQLIVKVRPRFIHASPERSEAQ